MNLDDVTPYLPPPPFFLCIIYDPGKNADV